MKNSNTNFIQTTKIIEETKECLAVYSRALIKFAKHNLVYFTYTIFIISTLEALKTLQRIKHDFYVDIL